MPLDVRGLSGHLISLAWIQLVLEHIFKSGFFDAQFLHIPKLLGGLAGSPISFVRLSTCLGRVYTACRTFMLFMLLVSDIYGCVFFFFFSACFFFHLQFSFFLAMYRTLESCTKHSLLYMQV